MIEALYFFAIGFVLAVITTPWVIRLAHAGIGLDVADEARKKQTAPVPRLGGMPVMLALAVGLIIILLRQQAQASDWFPILTGAVLMYTLGLWDDVSRLGAKKKLLGQLSIATLVWWLGLSIDQFVLPSYGKVELGIWSGPVTVFWLIAIPNIVNLIDGFDGLAGGLGVLMSVTLGIVGYQTEHYAVTWFALHHGRFVARLSCLQFPPR